MEYKFNKNKNIWKYLADREKITYFANCFAASSYESV